MYICIYIYIYVCISSIYIYMHMYIYIDISPLQCHYIDICMYRHKHAFSVVCMHAHVIKYPLQPPKVHVCFQAAGAGHRSEGSASSVVVS